MRWLPSAEGFGIFMPDILAMRLASDDHICEAVRYLSFCSIAVDADIILNMNMAA
jgi:hypothetical protein